MAKKSAVCLVLALVLVAWCTPVAGDVISIGGSACVLPVAPASWAPGANESDACIFGFYLEKNIAPDSAVTLNLTLTGDQDYGEPIIPGPEVTFGAGSVFDAFFVTLDPLGTTGGAVWEGSFTFDQKIILLITSDDSIYGGLESGDYSTLSGDRHELALWFSAGPHVDQLIVITTNAEPIPEPGSMILLGTGLLGLGRAWKKRRG